MTTQKTPVEVHRDAPAEVAPNEGWAPLTTLRDEIDRLFDDLSAGFWRRPMGRSLGLRAAAPAEWRLSPAVEITDCDGEYRIAAEVPGLAPADLDIRLNDGYLTIRGEKSEEKREEKADYLMSERRYGAFHRSLPLPKGIDPERVTAEMSNGVLRVILPKSAEAKAKERKVEIKAA